MSFDFSDLGKVRKLFREPPNYGLMPISPRAKYLPGQICKFKDKSGRWYTGKILQCYESFCDRTVVYLMKIPIRVNFIYRPILEEDISPTERYYFDCLSQNIITDLDREMHQLKNFRVSAMRFESDF